MTRTPKTSRVPRTRAGGRWTEAAFWSYVRSGLRRMSTTWPPRQAIMQNGRRPYTGPNKRQKWEHQCELCGGWFSAKEIQVDHINPCGKLTCYEDLPRFVATLFCEIDNLRKTCSDCNQKRNT